jgi:D-sedoheptulose 7-phosphate isomerase
MLEMSQQSLQREKGAHRALAALNEANTVLNRFIANPQSCEALGQAGELLANALRKGHRVFSAGNGGSMCDAMHFCEELSGKFRNDRPALAATAISDPSHMSCVGNDYGFTAIFSRYLEAHGRPGDVFVAISTSGSSPNILAAAKTAKEQGMSVIGLMGPTPSPLSKLCDITLSVTSPRSYSDRIQEVHIKCLHILVELVEFHGGWEKS